MVAKLAPQALARDVPRGTALAPADDEPRVDKAPEVVARCRRRHVALSCVGGTVDALKQAVLNGDDEPIGPVASLDELLEKRPAFPRLGDLLKPAARLWTF